jgi:hypothetical protein
MTTAVHTEIRPFPEAELEDLRDRLARTRWPPKSCPAAAGIAECR